MPANLKDLRRRIKSVKNMQQITKAMKLVSTSKFGRAQSAVVQSRPYAKALTEMTSRLVKFAGDSELHPLLNSPQVNKVMVLVISSERGLCGGYNANVAKLAAKVVEEEEAKGNKAVVCSIGKKAFQLLNRRRSAKSKGVAAYVTKNDYAQNPDALLPESGIALITTSFEKPTYEQTSDLAAAVTALYEAGHFSKLVVVYNRFQSAMTQIPSHEQLLPISTSTSGNVAEEAPIMEPSLEALIETALPRYLSTRLFQALLEAVASEHGARMTAMDNASRNAKEMLRKLEVTYQRARQASITNELIEIISGAEAL